MKIDQIIEELKKFPENFLDEFFDYEKYLKGKLFKKNMENTLLCELSLKKDWSRPEEDKAWQNL